MNNKTIVYVVIAILIVIAGYFFVVSTQKSPQENTNTDTSTEIDMPTTTDTADTSAKTTDIKIALLNTTGEGTGKQRGCDTVTMVTRKVPATTAVLTAAIKILFAEPEGTQPSTAYNFIARTAASLKFDHATVADGTASIYLTGSLSGLAGVCDDPRAASQLEETALQFPTVKKVQLYLNGKATTLTPSEKGE